MAMVILTFKVMPSSPELDIQELTKFVHKKITSFGGNLIETTTEPVAFGLKAIMIRFSLDEKKGSTDSLEESIAENEDVASVETVAVTRAMG